MKKTNIGAPLNAQLQGNKDKKIDDAAEIGVLGLDSLSGYIRTAYNAELYWPTVFPLYDRLRRSDPEIAMIRVIWEAFGREVKFEWELDSTGVGSDDKAAVDFANEIMNDIMGGMDDFRDTMLAYVPFMGFGIWEVVAGLRQEGWKAPDSSGWKSKYNDGKVGIRKLAFRDHSSFERWDMDYDTGEVLGMIQMDLRNGTVNIPLTRALHITFGDAHNPEGLATLEAVWRLERIKYGLEVVQGIGFEHAAGHAMFSVTDTITSDDKSLIRKSARALMTAQEGNYIALPEAIEASVIDVPFQAAGALLEAIRYYGLLKLQIFNMQWVAIASTAKSGAYSAMADASTMFLKTYNSMMSGFADQIGDQLWIWLVKHNEDLVHVQKPKLVASPVEKTIPLDELGLFIDSFASLFPLSDDDISAIRRKSGFLSEMIPEDAKIIREAGPAETESDKLEAEQNVKESKANIEEQEKQSKEESSEEKPKKKEDEEEMPEAEFARLVAEFEEWAEANEPELHERLVPKETNV